MKLLKILGGLVVLLLLLVFIVGFFIDGIAKSAIETAGTEALGVSTTLDGCHVGLLRGTFAMDGLTVANPEGFGDKPFLTLGTGAVAVSMASLSGDKVELPELTFDRIRLQMIQTTKGSNYGTILDNLNRFQGSDASKSEEGKRFIIRTLRITDVELEVVAVPELGLKAMTLPIDEIELKDIGSESDKGVLLSELTGIVLQAILQKATSSGRLPGMIQGALGGKLGDLKGAVTKEIEGRVKDATKDVKDRLKGLIGR